ncbi:MAG: hypothetical protein M0R16_11800 [Bacteroidales bacterium]|jgi:hypothetical protein|nr:hypothetical protein [Bacteroidales bacterium]
MKTFRISSTLISACVVVLFIAASTYDGHAKSFAKYNNSNTSMPVLSVKEQLDKAKKEGKSVFLVITGTGATGVDKALTIANGAKAKVPKSVVIQMNKDDAANSDLVTKFGIGFVQVPFILVLSPRGIAVAGFPALQATADLLVQSIPSPKKEEVLLAVSEKRPVFIVVSKKGLTDKTTVLANCKATSTKMPNKPSVVEFDFNDSKETDFLKQIGVTAINDKTITVVANASGQITDKYEGIVLETALTSSANKVIKTGGCAPGACGGKSSCGPVK